MVNIGLALYETKRTSKTGNGSMAKLSPFRFGICQEATKIAHVLTAPKDGFGLIPIVDSN